MRRHLITALAGAAGLCVGAVGTRAATGEVPNKSAIEQLIHDYIVSHPEVITEAMTKLQERQTSLAISADRKAIETPFEGAWAGSANPKVTLVMFSDYSCVYCRASAPVIDQLLTENPDLRVIWREIPVLGAQSVTAARAALQAAKEGEGRYLAFHRGVFAAGRPDDGTIASVAKKIGVDPKKLSEGGKSEDITREIASNLKIASRIGVDGTPAFIIGDKMLSGAVGHDALKKAIDAARAAG